MEWSEGRWLTMNYLYYSITYKVAVGGVVGDALLISQPDRPHNRLNNKGNK
jgi:hypothetical protein